MLTHLKYITSLPLLYISLSLFVSPCTVRSFLELVKFVFTIPGVTVFLSGRICQDPLEGFFGQQWQRGRVNENPSVQQFKQVRGNCHGYLKQKGPEVDNSILPKRKIKHK